LKTKIWIGCDPGKSGALVAIYSTGQIVMKKVPLVKGTREIDIKEFKNQFLSVFNITDTGELAEEVIVIIEDVHAIAMSSAKSQFQFGRALGILEGIVAALDLPFIKIQPKKWQGTCLEGVPLIFKPSKPKANKKGEMVVSKSNDTKAMALVAAKRLYPGLSFKLTDKCTNDDDGIVDALLIAHYGKLKF
jgi:hypothetical protein